MFLENKETHGSMANHVSVSPKQIDLGVPVPKSPTTAVFVLHPLSSFTEDLIQIPRACTQLDFSETVKGHFS
jgi:hypothetical protein